MGVGGEYSNQAMANACNQMEDRRDPEIILAEAFKRDIGVTMDPQALRIFIRWRWDRIQKLAHKIHDA